MSERKTEFEEAGKEKPLSLPQEFRCLLEGQQEVVAATDSAGFRSHGVARRSWFDGGGAVHLHAVLARTDAWLENASADRPACG